MILRADAANTKRSATLLMTVTQTGKAMVGIIFKSESDGARIGQREAALYHPKVKVYWQPKAVIDGPKWKEFLDDWASFKITQVVFI